jgi:hypothetical protein
MKTLAENSEPLPLRTICSAVQPNLMIESQATVANPLSCESRQTERDSPTSLDEAKLGPEPETEI